MSEPRAAQALAVAESLAAEPGITVAGFGARLSAELADLPAPDWHAVLFSGPDVDVALELHRIAAQATAIAARQRQYDMAVVRRQLELVRLGRSLHDELVAPAGTYGSPVAPEAVAFWRSATGLFRSGRGRRRRPTPSPATSARRRRAARRAVWIAVVVVVAGAGSGAAFAIAHRDAGPSSIAVPRVAGLAAAQAQQRLLDRGLISGGQKAMPGRDGTQPGTVVGTQPAAGSRVAPGAIVTLLVAGQPSATPAASGAPTPSGGTPAPSSTPDPASSGVTTPSPTVTAGG